MERTKNEEYQAELVHTQSSEERWEATQRRQNTMLHLASMYVAEVQCKMGWIHNNQLINTRNALTCDTFVY